MKRSMLLALLMLYNYNIISMEIITENYHIKERKPNIFLLKNTLPDWIEIKTLIKYWSIKTHVTGAISEFYAFNVTNWTKLDPNQLGQYPYHNGWEVDLSDFNNPLLSLYKKKTFTAYEINLYIRFPKSFGRLATRPHRYKLKLFWTDRGTPYQISQDTFGRIFVRKPYVDVASLPKEKLIKYNHGIVRVHNKTPLLIECKIVNIHHYFPQNNKDEKLIDTSKEIEEIIEIEHSPLVSLESDAIIAFRLIKRHQRMDDYEIAHTGRLEISHPVVLSKEKQLECFDLISITAYDITLNEDDTFKIIKLPDDL
jgi:hypothetical protein